MKDTIGRVFYAGLPTPLAMGIVEANSTINTGARWVDQINKTPVVPRGDIWHVYHDDGSYTTIASPATEGGKFYEYEGKQYLVADSFLHLESVTQQYKNLEGQDVDHKQLVSLSDRYETTHEIPLNQVVTSKVDDLGGLFQDANNFNQDISSWDTSAVFNLNSIFYGASTFNQNISNWDVSKVTDFESTVDGCYDFNQDLSKWDVSSGETFTYMFYGCYSFDYDLSGWCTPAAVEYEDFNYDAYLLTEERLPIWGECPGPIRIVNHKGGTLALRFDMGEGLGSGQNIWIKSIVFTDGVDGSISYTVPLGDVIALDYGNVHWNPTWSDDFGALSLDDLNYNNSITITNFGNVPSGVTHVHIDINQLYGADGTLSIVDAVDTNLVYGQYEFTPDPEVESTDLQTDFTSPKPNSRTVKASDAAVAGTLYDVKGEWFYVAKDRDDLVGVLRKFVTETEQLDNKVSVSVTDDFGNTQQVTCDALVTTFVTAFNDLLFDTKNKFNQDVSSWDTSNVTNMERVFRASTHFNQDLSKWDTSKVTTFRGMFQYCDDFNQDITGWNTSSVTDMSYMFDGATSFNQDIAAWRMSKVVNVSGMFLASNLDQDLSTWCVPNVTDYTDFATYAPNLTSERLPVWGTCPSYIGVRTNSAGTNTYYAKEKALPGRLYPLNDELYYVVKDKYELGELINLLSGGESGGDSMAYSMPEEEVFDLITPVEVTDITGLKAFITADRLVTTYIDDMSELFSYKYNFDLAVGGWDTSNVVTMRSLFVDSSGFNSDISGWDVSSVTDMSYMFSSTSDFSADLSLWNTDSVDNLSYLFYYTNGFSSDLSNWDTSSVTDMSYMFDNANVYNGNISGWDTSNVTNMDGAFQNTTDFSVDVSTWVVSNVITMETLCRGTDNFTSDISGWDVSGVENLVRAFGNTTNFGADISGWDTRGVTDMSYLLYSSADFNPDLSGWDTGNVTNMNSSFRMAAAFNSDISGWNTSSVTDMSYMFDGATTFNSDIGMWDVSAVTDMSYMFRRATSFNQSLYLWDVTNFTKKPSNFNTDVKEWLLSKPVWGTAPVDHTSTPFLVKELNSAGGYTVKALPGAVQNKLHYMDGEWYYVVFDRYTLGSIIYNASRADNSLKYSTQLDWFNNEQSFPANNIVTTGVEDFSRLFNIEAFDNFDQDLSSWDTSSVTNMADTFNKKANVRYGDISGWDVGNVTTMYNTFSGIVEPYMDISSWDTSKVTDMRQTFLGCTNFNQNISGWDVSNVTNMYQMFYDCTDFNQPIGSWDVSKVTTFEMTFEDCASFNQDLSGWNVSNVTNMSGMFRGDVVFNSDLSAWDTSKVTDMGYMFAGAKAFNQNISSWDVSNVTDMQYMFSYADAFNSPLINWNVSKVTRMDNMFAGGYGSALTFNQPLYKWDVSNVTVMFSMFKDNAVFNQNLRRWDVRNVTNHYYFNPSVPGWADAGNAPNWDGLPYTPVEGDDDWYFDAVQVIP